MEPSLLYLVRECFKEIMSIEGNLERAKKDLINSSDFTLAGIFNMFTGYSQARIGSSELVTGFERLGVKCSIEQAQLVVDRYDSDRDGKLSFWEFSNSLLPIETQSRDMLERRKAVWDISYETK